MKWHRDLAPVYADGEPVWSVFQPASVQRNRRPRRRPFMPERFHENSFPTIEEIRHYTARAWGASGFHSMVASVVPASIPSVHRTLKEERARFRRARQYEQRRRAEAERRAQARDDIQQELDRQESVRQARLEAMKRQAEAPLKGAEAAWANEYRPWLVGCAMVIMAKLGGGLPLVEQCYEPIWCSAQVDTYRGLTWGFREASESIAARIANVRYYYPHVKMVRLHTGMSYFNRTLCMTHPQEHFSIGLGKSGGRLELFVGLTD